MSGHTPWREIQARSTADPARVELHRRATERQLNRPWWRLARALERLRAQWGS